jgi:hypothetical protein
MSDKNLPSSGHGGYEKSDIDVRKVSIYGTVLLVVICGIGVLVTVFIFKKLTAQNQEAPASPMYQIEQRPPEPRLQAEPQLDLKKFRVSEEEKLKSYGWVDRANGIVRIPVDQAIERVVEKGLPSRPDARIEAAPSPDASKPKPGAAAPAAKPGAGASNE